MAVLSQTVEELRSDRAHGGSWMARRAVEALLEVASEPASTTAELLERLLTAGRELVAARPAMGAIYARRRPACGVGGCLLAPVN